MSEKATRDVYITSNAETHFVRYVDRAFGSRYMAAQFDARYTTAEEVHEWIDARPQLRLVNLAAAIAKAEARK